MLIRVEHTTSYSYSEPLVASTQYLRMTPQSGRVASAETRGRNRAISPADHPEARRVAFVGHQPDLGAAAELLTGAQSIRLRPAGVACVEFSGTPEPGSGELAWLLDPDLYG